MSELSQERIRAVGWRIFARLGDDGMLRAPWVHHLSGPNNSYADWPEPELTARCLFHEHEAPDPSRAPPSTPLRQTARKHPGWRAYRGWRGAGWRGRRPYTNGRTTVDILVW